MKVYEVKVWIIIRLVVSKRNILCYGNVKNGLDRSHIFLDKQFQKKPKGGLQRLLISSWIFFLLNEGI